MPTSSRRAFGPRLYGAPSATVSCATSRWPSATAATGRQSRRWCARSARILRRWCGLIPRGRSELWEELRLAPRWRHRGVIQTSSFARRSKRHFEVERAAPRRMAMRSIASNDPRTFAAKRRVYQARLRQNAVEAAEELQAHRFWNFGVADAL